MKYLEATKKLARLGCWELFPRPKGSHRHWMGPRSDRFAVLPEHPGKDLSAYLLKSAVRQLGYSWDEFMKA